MTTTTAEGAAAAANGHLTGFGTRPYRTYVLTALTFIYLLNFVDRGLLSVVGPDLVHDLKLSDTQYGLLTGFGFAVLYTFVGIPLAHMSETRNRVTIMGVCVALWSLMTAACGLSREFMIGSLVVGGFWMLLVFRIGVGIGEAGCTPPANSLIADYYPPKARSTALGFYAMGVTLGTMVANIVGGLVLKNADQIAAFLHLDQAFPSLAVGWRIAFFVVGLPGLLIALILKMTVKEPPRGYTDPPTAVRPERATFGETLKELFAKPTFWTMSAGATIAAFCGYGITSFQSLFLTRQFEIGSDVAALYINTPAAFASALGTLGTGWLAQRMYKKYPGTIAWLPGIGLILSVPFYIWAFTTGKLWMAAAGLIIAGFIKYGYLASQYTIGQGVVSMRMRATATAILLFVINMIGYGLGPLFIGAISDIFFKSGAANQGMAAGELTRAMCHPKVIGNLDEAHRAVCGVIYAPSLQNALLITATLYVVGGIMFLLCWRTLHKDMVAK